MTTYYISYGEPQPRFNWRTLLLILLGLLALAILAGIAYGIFLLVTGEDDAGIASPADASDAVPLAEAIRSLYGDNTNTIFLVDTSESISSSLPRVKQALADVALPYIDPNAGRTVENSRVSLVPFVDDPEPSPPVSLEPPKVAGEWLTGVQGLGTMDQPAYIYDAVGAAHDALLELDDKDRDNAIVLLSDGHDGGFQIVDPARAELCGPSIDAAPGEVCSPVLETIAIDPAGLVPCPADMAVVPGEVCNPIPVANAGETGSVYHAIDPNDVTPCPPELGGGSNACVDVTIGYQPFNPEGLQPCPEALGEQPGKACVEVKSELTQEALLATLVNSEARNLKVHTIGLGAQDGHATLKLLTEATGGEYIYAGN